MRRMNRPGCRPPSTTYYAPTRGTKQLRCSRRSSRPLGRTPDAFLYENPRALPRVMMVGEWQLADFAELLKRGWPEVDPRRTVLLERLPALAPAAGSVGAAAGTARIVRYGNVEIIVEVDAPAGGFLV